MRRLLSSALVLCLAAATAAAQQAAPTPVLPQATVRTSPAPPVAIDASIDGAFALLEEHQPAQAAQLLLPISTRADLTHRQRARAQRALGLASLALGRRSEAAASFSRALDEALAAADRSEAGWARQWAGTLHYEAGRPEEAQALWDVALDDFKASGDAYGEFEVLDDMAVKTSGLDRRPYSERCFAIAREQHDALLEARARSRWSHGLLEGGLPGPALIELDQAVAAMRPLGRKADPHFGESLALLGWALRAHGANDRAALVNREAIRLAELRGDVESEIWNYLGLGSALAELGQGARAEAAMRQGLRAAQRTGAPTSIRLLSQAVGWVALKRGRWQQAVTLIEAAQAMPGTDTTAMPLIHLSQAYRVLNRLDEAADRAARAVAFAHKLGLVDNELRALIETAHVAAARNDLHGAERTLGEVVDRLETYRSSLAHVDFLKQGFSDRFNDAYGLMVDLLMRSRRPGDALTSAERVRSRAFADLLAARRARETQDAQAGRWLLGGPSEPSGATTEHADSPLSVAALDAGRLVELAKGLSTTLVIYWIHDSGSYAWVVEPGGELHAATIRMSLPRLQQLVRTAVDVAPDLEIAPSNGSSPTSIVKGRNAYVMLYAALWAPVEPWLPKGEGSRVTVIPHGPLLALPFGALVDGRGRYLVERHALHYAMSGAVLLEASRRAERPAREGARGLLVADPRPAPLPESGVQLPALPAARLEVQSIAKMLRGPSDIFTGSRASEAAVRAALPGAGVVHFATHALVRDTDPLASYLVLGASENIHAPPERDGRLTASEIAGMTLSSDLVVLGACRSARGPISSDGIAGLTRAFLAAGAPSVVATLWDVTDDPTSRVMLRFYREYAAGVPKDQALRAAQLALIADLRAGRVKGKIGGAVVTYPEHPWLWAAPILVGAP